MGLNGSERHVWDMTCSSRVSELYDRASHEFGISVFSLALSFGDRFLSPSERSNTLRTVGIRSKTVVQCLKVEGSEEAQRFMERLQSMDPDEIRNAYRCASLDVRSDFDAALQVVERSGLAANT